MTKRKPPEEKQTAGRDHQARCLALMGCSDEQIAWFFDVDLLTLARWAIGAPSFEAAITPSQEDREAHHAKRAAQAVKKAAARNRRRATQPTARLVDAMRARLWAALKGIRKDRGLFSRLGFTRDELVAHLERGFQPGMTWANYGRWHVDHIKPCAKFDQADPAQFAECWNIDNLQPLWARDNIAKGARYPS